MKKTLTISIVAIFIVCVFFSCSAFAVTNYKVGETYDFNPELANAMKLNWFSSGENRAMLALLLGIQVADDRIMGSMDVLSGIMYNTSYTGKASREITGSNINMYVILGRYDKYFITILYSPDAKQASFILQNNSAGDSVSDMQMEILMAKTCSEYYKNEPIDMMSAISELDKLLN